jgi:hypothetical protein
LKFFKTFWFSSSSKYVDLDVGSPNVQIFMGVKGFVGCGNAIHFIIKYDVKEIIPLFMTNFYWLNLIFEVVVGPCDENVVQIEEEDNNMFGFGACTEEPSQTLVITKFYLF